MIRLRRCPAEFGPGVIRGLRGLMITGSVISSAGIVPAATFAALGVIPVLFLAQLAFIVAFGVLLDTLVVRSLLVRALSYDIGRRIWWPSKLSRLQPGQHRHGAPAHAGAGFTARGGGGSSGRRKRG